MMHRRISSFLFCFGILAIGFSAWQWHSLRKTEAMLRGQQPSVIDIRFAQFMSLHHHQAVVLSQMMRGTVSPPVLVLAETIRSEQQLELGEMRGWLRIWGQPHLPENRSMEWMLLGRSPPDDALRQYLLDCQNTPSGMTGLATDAELGELHRLQGAARERRYLELMLRHHEGGLPMARFAVENAGHPAVRTLAQRIVIDQQRETLGIRLMLAQAATATAP
ncbi:MAG: DUF305 domain-containing protein [Stagnimonas sp.]|nr:DUF305 domain-containing protein [Stagnimonas sp.]